MNFDQIECFIKTYEFMSFTKAASELYLAPSSLTYQITSLEDEIGCQLFLRTKKGLQATKEGEYFYHDALHLLTYYQNSRVALYNLKKIDRKQVYIGFDRVPDTYFVLDFFDDNPISKDLEIIYDINNLVSSISEFLVSSYTFAFMYLDELPDNKMIQFVELDEATYYGVMEATHPLAKRETLVCDDLKNQIICISKDYQYSKYQYPSINNLHKMGAMVRPYNDLSSVLFGIKAKQGIGIYPATNPSKSDSLQRIPFKDFPKLHFGIVYRTEETNQDVIKLIEEIVQYYKNKKLHM